MKRLIVAAIIVVIFTSVSVAHEDQSGGIMAPDGTYTDSPDPIMAPDGTYVGSEPVMTPDGGYVGNIGSDNE